MDETRRHWWCHTEVEIGNSYAKLSTKLMQLNATKWYVLCHFYVTNKGEIYNIRAVWSYNDGSIWCHLSQSLYYIMQTSLPFQLLFYSLTFFPLLLLAGNNRLLRGLLPWFDRADSAKHYTVGRTWKSLIVPTGPFWSHLWTEIHVIESRGRGPSRFFALGRII